MRTKKILSMAAAALMVGAVIPVLTPAAPAQAAVRIKNGGGKFLGASGNFVVVNDLGLAWSEVADSGYITLYRSSQGLNLGLQNNSATFGTRAVLTAPSGSYTQDWKIQFRSGTSQFRLQSRANTALCLGVSGGSGGTNVAVFTCDETSNQRWSR